MNYFEIKPGKLLSQYIQCYWMLEGKSGHVYENTERVLPDGCIELVINFKEPFKQSAADNNFELQPQTFVVGQIKNYKLLKPSSDFYMLGIRFKPTGAYGFFNFPLNDLLSQTVDACFIWGNEIKELTEKMFYSNFHGKIDLLEEFLSKKVSTSIASSKITEAQIESIIKANSTLTVGKLSSEFQLSKRQVERIFNKYIGIPPKGFLKIQRLRNIFKCIYEHKEIDWPTLSYISGYYDQPHFINDFRDFCGMNPSEYLSSSEQLAGYFINK